MRPDLEAVAQHNEGLVTRHDAVAAGYRERELKTLTRPGGDWVVVRRGVYLERPLWEAGTDEDRYRLRVRAATMTLTTDGVVSHQSAAAVHGMPLLRSWLDLVHLTRPGVTGGRTEHGVKHHPAPCPAEDLEVVEGLVVTRPARTAVDVGRELGYTAGVIASDAALRRGADPADLKRVLGGMTSWPRITQATAAVEVADAGAENAGETMARLLVLELGLGVPETQYVVQDGDWRAVVDLRLGRHLIEFDGRQKYVGRDRGGLADISVEEVLWREKRREDRIRSLDFGMSRLVWFDLFGRARHEARRRLLREITATQRRYGAA